MTNVDRQAERADQAKRIDALAAALLQRLRANFIITIDGECEAAAVAAEISVSIKTLRNWRALGCGPPSSRTVNGVAFYSLRELAAWIVCEASRDGAL